MKFRIFVGVCLVAIAYGTLYSNLPCWAQLMGQTFWCQVKDVPAQLAQPTAWDRAVKHAR